MCALWFVSSKQCLLKDKKNSFIHIFHISMRSGAVSPLKRDRERERELVESTAPQLIDRFRLVWNFVSPMLHVMTEIYTLSIWQAEHFRRRHCTATYVTKRTHAIHPSHWSEQNGQCLVIMLLFRGAVIHAYNAVAII